MGWDYVSAVPATTDGPYETVVPTLADSNATGIHRAVFFVRAATATLGVMYDSAPDSGYSVDNLPPAPPVGLVGAYLAGLTTLEWDASLEPDLWYYRIYRGETADFAPDAGSLIATSQKLAYTDDGPAGSYYKLSAVDVNGNESGCAVLEPDQTTGVPGAQVVQLRLYPTSRIRSIRRPRSASTCRRPVGRAWRCTTSAAQLVRGLVDGRSAAGQPAGGLERPGRCRPVRGFGELLRAAAGGGHAADGAHESRQVTRSG